ncbi:sensor histidine kinase [Spirosoma litoris]
MSIPESDGFLFGDSLMNAMPGKHLVLLPDAPNFTIAAVTDAYLDAFGIQRESLIGANLFEAFLGDQRDDELARQISQSLTQVVQTKRPHVMANQRHQWTDQQTGKLTWRTWRPASKPVLDSCGEVIYIIHTIEDSASAEELLKVAKANQYQQTLLNLMKEPLQVLQPIFENGEIIDFRFKLTNQAYASYANTTPEQLQGKKVGDVFPGYFETVSFTKPVETYKTGQSLTFEIHYDKDGLDLYNLMSTFKVDDEVVIYFTDFTRLRQLQLQLESKIDELKRSNENLQQFAYVASHDLQEPLRKIQSFADLLKNQYSNQLEDGASFLDRIQASAGRMSVLIRDLLALARISTYQETTEPVELKNVIDSVLADLEIRVQETGAIIEIKEPLPTLSGDSVQLGQLFLNLISNAIKFHRVGQSPLVRINACQIGASQLPTSISHIRSASTYHCISISDNGIGFEEKHTERIFQVFQRLHGRNEFAGTGVGLAICQKVALNHGGAITATSQPGQGATFFVYLPK